VTTLVEVKVAVLMIMRRAARAPLCKVLGLSGGRVGFGSQRCAIECWCTSLLHRRSEHIQGGECSGR